VVAIELFTSHLCGQEHTETAAAAASVANLDAAAMPHDDGLTDGQPEPVPGHVRLLGALVAVARLEDALAVLGGDAGTLVLYRQLQFAVIRDPSRNADWGAWRRIFDPVLDQVGEHALYLTRIHAN
jgi:hypothetical protein